MQDTTDLISKDGEARYFGAIFDRQKAHDFFTLLLEQIEWKNDEVLIFGKRIVTKRKVAWYAQEAMEYTYSNITKSAMLFTKELFELKEMTEECTGETYNSCLLNLYHNGSEGMGWHSDAEKDLKKNGSIASLSFGAERKFVFKHKNSKETVSVLLEHGSLLEMKGETQLHWLHRLPPTKKVFEPRINLTFRTINKR
ncbi:alpha-ketoglutarate-dependent dioxygenase AlkB [Bacteroidia bacterium]|nr:alpha-ketoglutarate-dependent dioxygenase AlkB [Bacteroidia bacterium]